MTNRMGFTVVGELVDSKDDAITLRDPRGCERWASDERILGSSEFVLVREIERDREGRRSTDPARTRVAPQGRDGFLKS